MFGSVCLPAFKEDHGQDTSLDSGQSKNKRLRRGMTPPEQGTRMRHQARWAPRCTWNLYPSRQMQHVRPGSSISSSICFRSAVLVTTWPFSFVCQGAPDSMSEGPPPHPATLAWGYSRERADPPHTPKGLLHRKGASLVGF